MSRITVTPDGRLIQDRRTFRCVLGRAGVVTNKQEGDGGTPAGNLPVRRVLYRADRVAPPRTGVPCSAIQPDDGWCDDPADPAYNRPVKLPHAGSVEALWRDDDLYDILAVLGWNDAPPVAGRGSAIFLHRAPADGAPTAGCIALGPEDLYTVLAACDRHTVITVQVPE